METEEWRSFFWGGSFYLPLKNIHGATVGGPFGKGTYQGYVSRHSQCSGHCATPCPSLGHTPGEVSGKTAGFSGHSGTAFFAGFLLGDLKKSPTGARKKKQKSVHIYIYTYTCICESCYIVYRILKITQVVRGPEMMSLFEPRKEKNSYFPIESWLFNRDLPGSPKPTVFLMVISTNFPLEKIWIHQTETTTLIRGCLGFKLL